VRVLVSNNELNQQEGTAAATHSERMFLAASIVVLGMVVLYLGTLYLIAR